MTHADWLIRALAQWLSLATMFGAAGMLVGHVFHVPWLVTWGITAYRPTEELVVMAPTTAWLFLLVGLALHCLAQATRALAVHGGASTPPAPPATAPSPDARPRQSATTGRS